MNIFFQGELDYLRTVGKAFAHANPKLASHLKAEGDDPDVERLLEGFAYLTGRVQENMAREAQEFNHSLVQVLWPNFLRPIPSATLMQLNPRPGRLLSRQSVDKGTVIFSRLIEGVRCPFRTTADCTVYPLKIDKSELEAHSRLQLRLHFSTLSNLPLKALCLDDLRLTFCGEMTVRQMLYLWFGRYLKKAVIFLEKNKTGGKHFIELKPQAHVRPIGLATSESLLPQPRAAFEGARLLQEFFTFPDKFYGYDLVQLGEYFADIEAQNFTLELTFERPVPENVRMMTDSIALYCVGGVNLFPHDGDPLLIYHEKTSYRLRPSGEHAHLLEIFSVDNVRSFSRSKRRTRQRHYCSFESFLHESTHAIGEKNHLKGKNRLKEQIDQADEQIYYRLRPFLSRHLGGFDYDISFVQHRFQNWLARILPQKEAVSLELNCFNRGLCHELAIGEICYPQAEAPDFVTYHNVVRPSLSVHPPLDGTLNWNLLANLSLNYMTLLSRDALAALLTIYDYESFYSPHHDRVSSQYIAGIKTFTTQPIDRVYKGLPVRGLKSVMQLRESAFHTEGEMYLFATLLAEFFKLSATVNSFHELEVWGEEHGETYQWSPTLH